MQSQKLRSDHNPRRITMSLCALSHKVEILSPTLCPLSGECATRYTSTGSTISWNDTQRRYTRQSTRTRNGRDKSSNLEHKDHVDTRSRINVAPPTTTPVIAKYIL
uniref:Uncharacterized protein n=1 Tax=Megaselia scalaris TaxID=36166 RepID=T1GL13_MEGSC